MKQWVTKLTDGSEKGTMLDLFGEPIVIKQKKFKEHEDKLVVSVTFKMTDAEFKKLQRMADKFGMSTSRYCRDAVRQSLADHECVLDPSVYPPYRGHLLSTPLDSQIHLPNLPLTREILKFSFFYGPTADAPRNGARTPKDVSPNYYQSPRTAK